MSNVDEPSNIIDDQTEILQNEVSENIQEELSEDMEVMGPGQILSDGRKKAGLTQQQVAEKLNFRETLVIEIENEQFDSSLPETFNRGYLRNYAKLVNVSQEDVLISYEQLNVAKAQASELQSFSKGTEKLAENNRIMWVSYFILAILIGSTVVWWMQNNAGQVQTNKEVIDLSTLTTDEEQKKDSDTLGDKVPNAVLTPEASSAIDTPTLITNVENAESVDSKKPAETLLSSAEMLNQKKIGIPSATASLNEVEVRNELLIEPEKTAISLISQTEGAVSNVTFTFSGDCWVNISDATGERIAWGVKKLGYVMKISGQAPFNVTLGRPELVAINFADENIDMSQFSAGNIAKFTLPIAN